MHYNTITVLYFRVTVVNWGFDIVANTQVSVGSTTSFATIRSPIDNYNSSKTALLFLQYVTPFFKHFLWNTFYTTMVFSLLYLRIGILLTCN